MFFNKPVPCRLAAVSLIVLCTGPSSRAQTAVPAPATQPNTATTAAAPATVAPVSGDVGALIAKLGSDNAQDRDAAQHRLQDMGLPAIPQLKKAAEEDPDPEIRSRAASVLATLKESQKLEALAASMISVHCKQSTPQEVFDAISPQCHASLTGMGLALPAPGKPGHTFTFDADQKPFWEIMTEVCHQLRVCPMTESPAGQSLRLVPVDRNWFSDSPHQISGPFYFGVPAISRDRTLDLAGFQTSSDKITVRLYVCVEPKLTVTHISDFLVKEAADDAGHSLMPRLVPRRLPVAPFRRSQNFREVDIELPYPELAPGTAAGSKLRILRGTVGIIVAQDYAVLKADDVLSKLRLTKPAVGGGFDVSVKPQGRDFLVTIQCMREGLSDDKWTAMTNCGGTLKLEDAAGHPLQSVMPFGMHSMNTNPGDQSFTSSGTFTRTGTTGDPDRLTWSFPTTIQSLDVPVTFKDLPMP
jgi:hypothetical protein